VLTAILGAGLCLGAVEVGVAARAERVGATAATGYLLAALFFGSAIGGIVWGRRTHTRARSTQLVFLLLMLAGGVTIAALMPNLIALGITLMFAGLAVSPAFVVSYLAADQLVPMERRTEASAWVNTANNIGSAVGSAGAGVIVDHGSTSIALICGAAIIAPAVLFVLISHRQVDEGRHPPGKQVPEVL
jgi:MFS family permease